jgi:hypothetical protein
MLTAQGVTMAEAWTEIWSIGRGQTRTYCGIAETEDGFAVDVFNADTCVWSRIYGTRNEAELNARLLKARYARPLPPPPPSPAHGMRM